MDILLVGTYTQHDAPAVLEKQELGKGIYLIPYNEILGDVAGTPLIIHCLLYTSPSPRDS